jgi:hypothetical protein
MVYNHIVTVDGTYADVASLPLSHRRIRSELDHEVCERVYEVTKKALEDTQIQNVQLVCHNYFTDAGVLRISKRIYHINDGDIATFALTLSWKLAKNHPGFVRDARIYVLPRLSDTPAKLADSDLMALIKYSRHVASGFQIWGKRPFRSVEIHWAQPPSETNPLASEPIALDFLKKMPHLDVSIDGKQVKFDFGGHYLGARRIRVVLGFTEAFE